MKLNRRELMMIEKALRMKVEMLEREAKEPQDFAQEIFDLRTLIQRTNDEIECEFNDLNRIMR